MFAKVTAAMFLLRPFADTLQPAAAGVIFLTGHFEYGSDTMNQQGSQLSVAALANTQEVFFDPTAVLPRCQA